MRKSGRKSGPARHVHARSKIDRCENFGRALIESTAERQEAFDARKMRATFDGADLRDAQARARREVLQGPVPLHTEHFDAVAETASQAVLRGPAETESIGGIPQHLPHL